MDELLRSLLTGKRANLYRRFRQYSAAVGLLGALLVLVPVLFGLAGKENFLLSVVLYALGALSEVAGFLLECAAIPLARNLMEVQHAADLIETSGDERGAREAVYEGWRKCFPRARAGKIVAAAMRAAGYLLLAGGGIAVACGALQSEFLFLACVLLGMLAVVSAVVGSVAEGRAAADLYGLAEREIDFLKRMQGEPEQKISRDRETARGFSPLPRTVALFLKEGEERADFRRLSGRSSLYACLSGAMIGALTFLLPTLTAERWGETAMWGVLGAVCLIVISGTFALVSPLQRKLKLVYARNAAKLGENDADALRLQLQKAWIFQQRVGNLIFSAAIGIALVAGTVVGILLRVFDQTVALVPALGGCICSFLVYAAVLSMIVWLIFYGVQRHKLRPIERELSEKLLKLSEEKE